MGTVLIILLSIGLIAVCTMSFVGGVYANRQALPLVGLMFGALLAFGVFW